MPNALLVLLLLLFAQLSITFEDYSKHGINDHTIDLPHHKQVVGHAKHFVSHTLHKMGKSGGSPDRMASGWTTLVAFSAPVVQARAYTQNFRSVQLCRDRRLLYCSLII